MSSTSRRLVARLVVASGNALPTGRVLFADEDAVLPNESDYSAVLERIHGIDAAVVISASGTKHAPLVVADLVEKGLTPHLITCDRSSPAAALLDANHVTETPSIAEPITYKPGDDVGAYSGGSFDDQATHH